MNEKIIIQISDIDARDRLRPVDQLIAFAISAALEEKGLIQPIVVRLRADGEGYQLIAGAHRLAALTLLGKTELIVGAEVVIREEASDEEARLSEIYENVFQSSTSPFFKCQSAISPTDYMGNFFSDSIFKLKLNHKNAEKRQKISTKRRRELD